jgi:para-nitrobenzyl esterase
LFHRAIAESGAPMAPMLDLKTSGGFGAALAKLVGADTAQDQLAALRAKPAADLLAAQDRMFATGMLVGPNVDGWVLPDMTARIFERGEQLKVPLLAGTNALEMTTLRVYLPRFERTAEGYRKWVSQTSGAGAPKVLELYPASAPAEIESATLALSTDMLFTCPTRVAARAMTKAGQRTYLYQFTRIAPGGDKLGAFHASEISYVFGNRLAWLPRDQTDEALSQAMGGYWTRFAATGDPNGGEAPKWRAHGGDREAYLEFGNAIAPKVDLKREVCDALEPAMRAGWALQAGQ